LAEVVAIREANSGTADLGALAVNPTILKQGLLGNEATALNQAISKYAGESRLTRFTVFQAQSDASDWHFMGFDVNNGTATPMVIPTLAANATAVDFSDDFNLKFENGSFVPQTTSTTDDMQLLASVTAAQAASAAQQQAAIDATFRIENPNMNSPNTIDCASCHLAGPARQITAEQGLKLSTTNNANAFAMSSKFVTTADLARTTPSYVPTFALNLHAFSYNGTDAMINQRVVNESAAIIDYVNTNLTN
jgi:Pyruvate/2-oxoacid:ferredoxin oxidoreductase delta subunit